MAGGATVVSRIVDCGGSCAAAPNANASPTTIVSARMTSSYHPGAPVHADYDRAMRLEGSCQCGKVRFTVESDTPYPYQFCFCSICRKCSGALTANIMGKMETLEVRGERHLKRYHARVRGRGGKTRLAEGWRVFCGACGTHLWLEDKRWPEGVWPNASAIDSELPVPPAHVFLMTRYKPTWVPWPDVRHAEKFVEYPKLSIADWHEKHIRKSARRR